MKQQRGIMKMKWKRIYAESGKEDFFEDYNEDIKKNELARSKSKYEESVNDAAEELEGLEEPFKIVDVDEITPDSDGYGSLGSDAQFLIDEYIGDQARRYYRNGVIPEDEEEELRNNLTAVLVEFKFWKDEDEDNYAGYEDGQIMYIIDTDGWQCNVDFFDYNGRALELPKEVYEGARDAAFKYVGVPYKGDCSPD